MRTCQPCALRASGNTARADTIEAIRTQRLLLAILNGGAADSTAEIATEIKGCSDCLGRLASQSLLLAATALAHHLGGVEPAAQAVQHGLLEDIDAQNPQGS